MIGSSKINVNQPVPNNPCLDRKPTEFERTPLPPQKKGLETQIFFIAQKMIWTTTFHQISSEITAFALDFPNHHVHICWVQSVSGPLILQVIHLICHCFRCASPPQLMYIYICMYVSYIRRINVYVICDIWKMMCIICLSTFVICVTCKWLIDDLITCNSHLIYSIHTIDSKGIWAADKGFGSCQMFVLTPETNVSVRKRFVFHKLTNLCWHPYCWLGVISFGGIP